MPPPRSTRSAVVAVLVGATGAGPALAAPEVPWPPSIPDRAPLPGPEPPVAPKPAPAPTPAPAPPPSRLLTARPAETGTYPAPQETPPTGRAGGRAHR